MGTGQGPEIGELVQGERTSSGSDQGYGQSLGVGTETDTGSDQGQGQGQGNWASTDKRKNLGRR